VNETVTSTDNYEGTLSRLTDSAPDNSVYTDYAGATFRIVTYVAGAPNTYPLPYTMNSAPTVGEFDPATELINY
jgi:hypothetical protein